MSSGESPSPRAPKRRRVTVSCLACNKRKVRCDRTLPCYNCRTRNESDKCEYIDGNPHNRAPPAWIDIPPSVEVESLKDRMKELEGHIGELVNLVKTNPPTAPSVFPNPPTLSYTNLSGPSRPADSTPSSGTPRSTTLDKTFLALDDLSRGSTSSRPNGPSFNPTTDAPFHNNLWPNIFVGVDGAVRPPHSEQMIYDIVSSIPKDDMLSVLIDHHHDHDGAYWHFVQRDVLEMEIQQFTSVRSSADILLIDPAWLALLIAISRASLHSLLSDDQLDANILASDDVLLRPMEGHLETAFDLALHCARALHEPQFRILQALLVFVSQQQFGWMIGSQKRTGLLWRELAISICKQLRLHLITDETPDQELPSDLAFPPNSPLFVREWSSRLTHNLVFVDQVMEAIETDRRGGDTVRPMYTFGDLVTTPRPRNFRDQDLWNPRSKYTHQEPHPSFVLTETIWQIHGFRVAHFWTAISQSVRDPATLTPEVVQAIDSEVRQGDFELLSLRSGHQLKEVEDVLLESFHGSYQQRIIRLHRHFFLRSYSDQTYAFSQAAALAAARTIIKGHKEVQEKHRTYKIGYLALVFFSHHVSAAILLFIHGCFMADERVRIRAELESSLDLFAKAKPPGPSDTQHFWLLSVARGRLFIRAMSEALFHDPPGDLPAIEKFMIDLNDRGVEANDLEFASDDPNNVIQFTLPSFFGVLDDPNLVYPSLPNAAMQNPAQLDWDNMFKGF